MASEKSIKSPSWVIARLPWELTTHGRVTIHNESGRMFRHIHNHDVSAGIPARTFNLSDKKSAAQCAKFIAQCRLVPGITHLSAIYDHDGCVTLEPIRHVSNHIVAGKIGLAYGADTYITRKKTASIVRRCDQKPIGGYRIVPNVQITRRDEPFICMDDTQVSERAIYENRSLHGKRG